MHSIGHSLAPMVAGISQGNPSSSGFLDISSILFILGFLVFLVWLIYRYMVYQQNEKDREAQWANMLSPEELKALATDMQAEKKGGRGGVRVEIDSIDSILDEKNEEEERKHREAVLRKRRQAQMQRSSSGSKPQVARQGAQSGKKPQGRGGGTSGPQQRKPVDSDRSTVKRSPPRRKPHQD